MYFGHRSQPPDRIADALASSSRASKPSKSSSAIDPLPRSTVMSIQPLFAPVRMGDLDLPNRIVMAPLTRMRAIAEPLLERSSG